MRENGAVKLALAGAALCALVFASCGGSTRSATSATTGGGGQRATTPVATAPATGTTQPVSGSPLCRASELAASFLGGQGATGHGELGFALRNTSRHSCHTYGFPGVRFLGQAGQALPTDSTRTTHDFFGSTPLAMLVLEPGANASFRLGVTHGAVSTVGCTTAAGLQVIPPEDTSTLRVAIGNGGAYECRAATVSPLRPGESAYP